MKPPSLSGRVELLWCMGSPLESSPLVSNLTIDYNQRIATRQDTGTGMLTSNWVGKPQCKCRGKQPVTIMHPADNRF